MQWIAAHSNVSCKEKRLHNLEELQVDCVMDAFQTKKGQNFGRVHSASPSPIGLGIFLILQLFWNGLEPLDTFWIPIYIGP